MKKRYSVYSFQKKKKKKKKNQYSCLPHHLTNREVSSIQNFL